MTKVVPEDDRAWGFYPVRGNPKEVLQHIEIPELASRMEEMSMMKNMVQTATATLPVEKPIAPAIAQAKSTHPIPVRAVH